MHQLVTMIENGIPDSRVDFPKSLQEYFQFKDDLYTIDGVILYNDSVNPFAWNYT